MKHLVFSILLIFNGLAASAQDQADVFLTQTAELEKAQLSNFEAFEKIPPDARKEYIDKYRKLAIQEMQRAGIPASISMAQGIVESNAGQSILAKDANNHFGIKCGTDWDGKTMFSQDDDRDANGNPIQSCFRKYRNAEASWIDHSDFIRDPKKYNRYGFLFHLDPKDYRSWAYGLKSAGYATGAGYAESLINVIETNRLYELDNQGVSNGGEVLSGGKVGTQSPVAGRGTGYINDVRVVLAKKDETLDDIGRRVRVSSSKLVSLNDNAFLPTQKLTENSRVFIQKKRNKWRGHQKVHYVKDTQLMIDVAQQYGIKLDKLLKKNRLVPGEEPAPGETVKIRGLWKRASKPKLRNEKEMAEADKAHSTDSNSTAGTSPTSRPTTSKPTNSTEKTDGKPQNPYSDELPFEIGDDKTATDVNRDGSPVSVPTPPPTRPTAQPKPPIATTDGSAPSSSLPSSDRARPSGSSGGGNSTTPTNIPPPVTRPTTQPSGGTAAPSGGSTARPTTTISGAVYHEVVKGDTLYNLSKRYGTTPAAIQKLNEMADNNIKIGTTIRVK